DALQFDPVMKFSIAHEQLEIELQSVTLVPGTRVTLCNSIAHEQLEIELQSVTLVPGTTLFLALRAGNEPGSAVVPFGENFEGSTIFLPFQADRLCIVQIGTASGQIFERRWEKWEW